MDVKQRMQELAQAKYGQELAQCGNEQLYHVLLQLTQELSQARPAPPESGSCITSPPSFSSASC